MALSAAPAMRPAGEGEGWRLSLRVQSAGSTTPTALGQGGCRQHQDSTARACVVKADQRQLGGSVSLVSPPSLLGGLGVCAENYFA